MYLCACMYKGLQTKQRACCDKLSDIYHLSRTNLDSHTELQKNQRWPSSHKKASGSTLGSEILKKYVYFTLRIIFSISPEPFILIDQKVLWKWHTHTHGASLTSHQPTHRAAHQGIEEKPQPRRSLSEPPPNPTRTCDVLRRTDRSLIFMLFSERLRHGKTSWNSMFFRLERWRAVWILTELKPRAPRGI